MQVETRFCCTLIKFQVAQKAPLALLYSEWLLLFYFLKRLPLCFYPTLMLTLLLPFLVFLFPHWFGFSLQAQEQETCHSPKEKFIWGFHVFHLIQSS